MLGCGWDWSGFADDDDDDDDANARLPFTAGLENEGRGAICSFTALIVEGDLELRMNASGIIAT